MVTKKQLHIIYHSSDIRAYRAIERQLTHINNLEIEIFTDFAYNKIPLIHLPDCILILLSDKFLYQLSDFPLQLMHLFKILKDREGVYNVPVVKLLISPCQWEKYFSNTHVYPKDHVTISELENEAKQKRAILYFVNELEHLFFNGKDKTPAVQASKGPFYLNKLKLQNFKCFEVLELNFQGKGSVLPGRWHCIAGINGAGKSSILEAICLGLLGSERAEHVGTEVIARKCRQGSDETHIHLDLQKDEKRTQTLHLPLGPNGLERRLLNPSKGEQEIWSDLGESLFLSFGATRDFSEDKKPNTRHVMATRRHLTLFDPLEPLIDERDILQGIDQKDFKNLLQKMLWLLPEEFRLGVSITEDKGLRFSMHEKDLPLLELPSGLRSLVIWFTVLIREWCRISPGQAGSGNLADIAGLVLIDEIDLHLHPKLQRVLVPTLRKALPKVQWIVTTHSPLVISSFDRHELTWLDADSHLREIEQQPMALTPDDIIERLMETEPRSVMVQEYMDYREALLRGEKPKKKPDLPTEIADQLAMQSMMPDLNEEETKKKLNWWKDKVKEHRHRAAND